MTGVMHGLLMTGNMFDASVIKKFEKKSPSVGLVLSCPLPLLLV